MTKCTCYNEVDYKCGDSKGSRHVTIESAVIAPCKDSVMKEIAKQEFELNCPSICKGEPCTVTKVRNVEGTCNIMSKHPPRGGETPRAYLARLKQEGHLAGAEFE